MPLLRPILKHVHRACLLLLCTMWLLCGEVWAQEPAAGPETKSYASAYLLVTLLVALGYMGVLRPSMRQREVRRAAREVE